jgi:peptidyl-tRNA hydrolase
MAATEVIGFVIEAPQKTESMAFQTCFQNWIRVLTEPTSQDSMTVMTNPHVTSFVLFP